MPSSSDTPGPLNTFFVLLISPTFFLFLLKGDSCWTLSTCNGYYINGCSPLLEYGCYPLLFPAAVILVEYILLTLLIWFNYLQFAIPMPFFRNGVNHLYFQIKSGRPKSQMLYSLAENITMCYSNVTRWLHSLLVFAKEGILLEFYDVRHCKPRKFRYVFVTFFGCLNRGGGQEKKGRMVP